VKTSYTSRKKESYLRGFFFFANNLNEAGTKRKMLDRILIGLTFFLILEGEIHFDEAEKLLSLFAIFQNKRVLSQPLSVIDSHCFIFRRRSYCLYE